ncbi:MAG: endonuclease/exonuclease/phosphatase family protein [Opitutae bacterium]|nr:endonuclease/exonuclease/phosphatase family protein [Opitutae bacterium]
MKRLRLLTYNIAHGRGLTLHQSLRRESAIRAQLLKIGRLITRLDVDIAALQEVDENSSWSGSFDHLACLAENAGMPHVAFGITNRRVGRYHLNYGNAVLSRFPITNVESHSFGPRKVGEKGFMYCELELPQGRLPLLNLHLNHRSRAQRLKQAGRVMEFLDSHRRLRAARCCALPLLCGDMNNPAHQPDATATLLGYLEQHADYTLLPKGAKAHTFPSVWPQRALDYIYLPAGCAKPEAQVVRSMLSDHRPVLAEFSL